jgi:hypothetical protein
MSIKWPKHGNNHIAVQTRGRKSHLHSTAHVHPARSWLFVASVLCIPDIYKVIRRSLENESSRIIPAHNRCECWIVRANWILKPNWRLKSVQYHLQSHLHNIMQHKSVDIVSGNVTLNANIITQPVALSPMKIAPSRKKERGWSWHTLQSAPRQEWTQVCYCRNKNSDYIAIYEQINNSFCTEFFVRGTAETRQANRFIGIAILSSQLLRVFYDYVTSSLHTLVNSTELPTHRQPQIRIRVHI